MRAILFDGPRGPAAASIFGTPAEGEDEAAFLERMVEMHVPEPYRASARVVPREEADAAVSAPQLADYQRAVEDHVDAVARARSYSSAVSCVSYMLADPSDPTLSDEDRAWDAEARVFHRWRNAVWAQVFATLEAWNGGGEAPTIEGLIASLPAIEWPS